MPVQDQNAQCPPDVSSEPSERPPLHVPHKETPAVTAWRLARVTASGLPRSRTQLRKRGRRLVDQRVFGKPRAAHGLITGWQVLGRASHASLGAQTSYVEASERLAARMVRSGHHDLAATLLEVAERGVADDLVRSPLSVRRAVAQMNAGRADAPVGQLVRDALAAADHAHTSGDLQRAATHLQDAFNVAFHRVLHFEDHPSPLAADPDRFLAPFHESSTFRATTTLTPRLHGPVPADRPQRLLFVTGSNFNFAKSLIDDYGNRPNVEVRAVNLLTQEDGPTRLSYVNVVRDRLTLNAGRTVTMPASVAEELDWADTVFVEWGHRALTWISSLSTLRARVIVRVHSYEAMTQFPLTTNWAGVHDVIFVSDHIRRLVESAVPQLLDPGGPRIHTIPNKNDFQPYMLPKKPGAEFTLGLVGWGQVVKDPLWALEVLERLRAHDPRYGIRLLGNDFADPGKLTRAAATYRDVLHARIAELGDAVHMPGYASDMPESLRRVGVILSTSHREGTHEGFLEGAASGAFPVARNWPFVARWGGARSMVPDAWVVGSPAEAAQRILSAQEGGTLMDQGTDAAAWVREHYDWSVVGPGLDAVVLGGATANPTTPDPTAEPLTEAEEPA